MMPLKKIVAILFLIACMANVKAQQQTADIGLFAGGAIPLTDYSKLSIFNSIKPNYGLFYRYNFNSRYSLRINGLYGNVGAEGYLNDQNNSLNFNKSVIGLSALFEINYLDFLIGEERMKFSPYVYYGFGMSLYPGINGQMVVAGDIPIGTGVKYAFAKRWAVGAEVSAHKLFNDELDNLDNPYGNNILGEVNDSWHNNDWITYFGLTLTYKFYWGSKPCPAYSSKY